MSASGQVLSVQPGSYKDHFMAGLRSKDMSVSAAAVRVLCGLLHNKSVDPEFLDAAGMPLTWMCLSALSATFAPEMLNGYPLAREDVSEPIYEALCNGALCQTAVTCTGINPYRPVLAPF